MMRKMIATAMMLGFLCQGAISCQTLPSKLTSASVATYYIGRTFQVHSRLNTAKWKHIVSLGTHTLGRKMGWWAQSKPTTIKYLGNNRIHIEVEGEKAHTRLVKNIRKSGRDTRTAVGKTTFDKNMNKKKTKGYKLILKSGRKGWYTISTATNRYITEQPGHEAEFWNFVKLLRYEHHHAHESEKYSRENQTATALSESEYEAKPKPDTVTIDFNVSTIASLAWEPKNWEKVDTGNNTYKNKEQGFTIVWENVKPLHLPGVPSAFTTEDKKYIFVPGKNALGHDSQPLDSRLDQWWQKEDDGTYRNLNVKTLKEIDFSDMKSLAWKDTNWTPANNKISYRHDKQGFTIVWGSVEDLYLPGTTGKNHVKEAYMTENKNYIFLPGLESDGSLDQWWIKRGNGVGCWHKV